MTEIVKKDGKVTLYPKPNEQDQLLTKIKNERVFNFRIRIKNLLSAVLTVKMNL